MMKKHASTKKPGAPIILSLYESDLKRLEELAIAKGLKIADVFHQVLAAYSNTTYARMLLEREEENLSDLTMAS
jgi:hypothetical protein